METKLFLTLLGMTVSGLLLASSKPVTLESLESQGYFQGELKGEAIKAPFSGKSCVYYESVYGEKGEKKFAWHIKGPRTIHEVGISTKGGELSLPVNALRIYTKAIFSKTFRPTDADKAPDFLKEDLIKEKKPLTLEEFCLEPGKPYDMHVDRESYFLPPPRPDAQPSQHENRVLEISDTPFQDGKSSSPQTPATSGITY